MNLSSVFQSLPPQLESVAALMSNPSWDVIALLIFVVVGCVYGVWGGRGRLVAVLFALYASKLLFDNAWFLDRIIGGLPSAQLFFAHAGVFAIFIIILSVVFTKCFSGRILVGDRWWQMFLLSFLEVGIAASILFSILPPSPELYTFSPLVERLFASSNALFWWLLAPIPILYFVIRPSRK